MDAAAGGAGGSIDSGLAGASGGILGGGGTGGAMDVGAGGTGGDSDAPADIPISGTGGVATGGTTGGLGGAHTGGIGGGAGGVTGKGGATGTGGKSSGGAAGTGGSHALDAGADGPTDLATNVVEAGALLNGLVAYYPCEGATGTTLADMSGHGNDGVLSTGTLPDGGVTAAGYSFVTGMAGNGKALALAKAGNGYVSLPTVIFANATDITIATWVNITTSQNWQRLFDIGINANSSANPPTGSVYMNLVPKTGGSNLAFAITTNGFNNEQQLSAATLSVGTWKHVAVVLGAGVSTVYIDGGVATTSTSVTLRPKDLGAINYATIGKSGFSVDPFFDGQIDELRVYNRALSASEVQALFQFRGQ
jgi:hypothetical protein